jgi:zinc protease
MRRPRTKLVTQLFCLLFVGAYFSACSSPTPIPARPELIKQVEVDFTPPEIEKWKTENGLEVFLLEDHELPLVSGQFYFRFGSLTDDSSMRGQTDALMSQLRAGGILGSTPQSLDTELDAVGASIEGSGGGEFSSLSFFSHRDDEDLIFSKLSGMLTAPAFDERRLALWKSQALDAIGRRREDPDVIAGATFATALYGENSPYSRLPSRETISAITSEKLKELAKSKILPGNSILAVSGDITRKQLDELIEKHFKTWSGSVAINELPTPSNFTPKAGLYFVDSKFEQSAVLIGHRGPERLSKDQFAISVFNRYFGRGGFGSVLFMEVRSKRGFAYDVDGGFNPGAKTGDFVINMGTRSEVTELAIREVINQLSKARTEPPPKVKIDDVKEAVKQGFIFNFAKPVSALTREVFLDLLGYPKDFNKTYLPSISAVTEEEVRQCAADRISIDDLIIVVVGKLDGKNLAKSLGVPFYDVKFDTFPQIQ